MATAIPRKPAAMTAPAKASQAPQTVLDAAPAPGPLVPAPTPQTAVALPDDLAAELAAEARDEAAKERPAISRLSLRGGVIQYMGNEVPNNTLDVVILAGGYWNKWYAKKWNPNVIVNPSCFAVTADYEESKNMEPHENVDNPVHESCNGCPKMEWGSAGTPEEPSRGKACKETRRLAVVPADALESAEAFLKAEIAIIDVPVTSVQNYASFVNTLQVSVKRPMYAVVTTLGTVRHPKWQFQLTFSPISVINDVSLIGAIRARLEEAKRAVSIPYDESYLQGESQDKGTGQGPEVKTAKFAG